VLKSNFRDASSVLEEVNVLAELSDSIQGNVVLKGQTAHLEHTRQTFN
jgi:hypothetical protein